MDLHLRLVIQSSESYIKDSGGFTRNIKNIQFIPSNTILFAADMVGLHPPPLHGFGIIVLENILDKNKKQNISTADLIKTTDFFLAIVILTLMVKLNSKYPEQKQEQNVFLPMDAYTWMNLKIGFSV